MIKTKCWKIFSKKEILTLIIPMLWVTWHFIIRNFSYTNTFSCILTSISFYSARFGSLTCLEILVDIPGINVNLRNKQGDTPLHLAVRYEEDPEVAVSMVDILLDSGADPR